MFWPQVFANVCVALDIGVVDNGGVIPRRRLVDAVGQGTETRNRVDRNHVLRAAFPKHAADARGHRGDPHAALAGHNRDDILPTDMPTDTSL